MADKWLERAVLVYGDKYNYDNVVLDGDKKVKINCRIHGEFEQTPANHIDGANCPKCRLRPGCGL